MDPPQSLGVSGAPTSSPSTLSPTTQSLLIALVVLSFVGLTIATGFYILRYVRRQRQLQDKLSELPMYEDRRQHRRSRGLSLKHGSTVNLREKDSLIDSPPQSPVPEIRITFPEEVDEQGKTQSGRVVVVRVGEHGVGLEPVREQLPPYKRYEGERFESLDLERIGGLKEKESR